MKRKDNQTKNSTWEYFDDCLICQAMKEADKQGRSLDAKELELAFAKQNLKNKLKK